MLKKSLFYGLVILLFFGGQFFLHPGLAGGTPPEINKRTLNNQRALPAVAEGPAIIYFWADWCGICRLMKESIDQMLQTYPGLTVAVKSGDDDQVEAYLKQQHLNWSVVNDRQGVIADHYGVEGVPVVFFIDKKGDIVFSSVGFTSTYGLQLRLWLAGLF